MDLKTLLGLPIICALAACTPKASEVPGISLGAPDIGWARKNEEQKFGYMAAQVEPRMHGLFQEYDASYGEGFNCQTCHGANAELVDWKMPNNDLYALPTEDTLQASLEYDTEVTNFMMAKVTPALKEMLNTGLGEPVVANCFSCHPAE